MSDIKDIKNRIKSVRDTQKITNAMYLISSTKMNRAKREMEQSKPYFTLLEKEIKRIFLLENNLRSPYFKDFKKVPEKRRKDEEVEPETCGMLIITANKGLAGSYNQNVIKAAEKVLKDRESSLIYTVGEVGYKNLSAMGYSMEHNFNIPSVPPELYRARQITAKILDDFEDGKLNEVYIAYTRFTNGLLGGEAVCEKLLPLESGRFTAADEEEKHELLKARFKFIPSAREVLNQTIRSYITGYIYYAMVDSYCAEQNARMVAMDSANRNADEILSDLSMKYNHVRQGDITQEITEISSGSRSLKRKGSR